MAQILLNPIVLGCTAYALHEIEELLKNLPINMSINESHILYKRSHDFNEKCGEECILFVVEKIKEKLKVDIVNEESETPSFKSRDNCKHGCTIEVRLGLSNKKEWKINTAYHPFDKPCLVNPANVGGGCYIN